MGAGLPPWIGSGQRTVGGRALTLLPETVESLHVAEWEAHKAGRPELAALEFPTNISKFRPGPLLVPDGCPAKLEAQRSGCA